MGEVEASIVVACMLMRTDAIHSAGGYLRDLTRKAETGAFSTGPMLMALIGGRKREKRRAGSPLPSLRCAQGGRGRRLVRLSCQILPNRVISHA